MLNTNLEITQKAMEDFRKIQQYMLIAKGENATINVAGVNLTDIDIIKE